MPVCYLDFDGVLHYDNVARAPRRAARMLEPGHSILEWAPVLVDALRPYPRVVIVLATSWVASLGYDRTRAYLPPGLRERVKGATFHSQEHGSTRNLRDLWLQTARGVQVARDIERRQPLRWFAIDDAVNEFLPWQEEWLVPCASETGLGAVEAQRRLSELLQRVHQ